MGTTWIKLLRLHEKIELQTVQLFHSVIVSHFEITSRLQLTKLNRQFNVVFIFELRSDYDSKRRN